MQTFRLSILAFASLILFSVSVQAGVYVVQKIEGPNPSQNGVNTIYIDADQMRMETKTPAEHTVMIFRNDKQLFWIIDVRKKTYFEMTKESMQNVAKKAHTMMEKMMEDMTDEQKEAMKAMQQRIKESMSNMPDEEKEKMHQQMPAGMMDMHGAMGKIVYKKVGGEKVGKYDCTKYEGYKGKYRVEEVWAAEPSSLGVSESDLQVFEKMTAFLKTLTGPMSKMLEESGMSFAAPTSDEKGYPGLPIKEVTYDMGKVNETTVVQEITKKSFSPDLFELPPNLVKNDPIQGMGAGMPQY